MNFSDLEIDLIASRLDLDLSDGQIREIIRRSTSCDVQACPGSGKTAVLSAKISLIAAAWNASGSGICILSHTNVARDEIERRLRSTSEGQRLLKPPHFLGTIQSFVDRFLALPYLRSKGLAFEAIDDVRHARLAKKYFGDGRYAVARAWLSKRHLGMEVADFAGDLEFSGSLDRVRHRALSLPGETSNTYKSLLSVKRRVAASGIYRYGDMFAVARTYVCEFPWIVAALRHRFPVVFLDEAQDTSRLQFDVLMRIFDRREHTVHRFGDNDQAIYEGLYDTDDEAPGDFPAEPIMTLGSSRRFGPFIADQVAALSLSSQQILGKGVAQQGKRNSVFIFEEDAISYVLPAFGDLVLAEFEGPAVLANAVGRRRKPGTGKTIPTSIGDYCADYDSSAHAQPAPSSGPLADALAGALSRLLSGGGYHEAMMALWRCLRDWARALGATDPATVYRHLRADAHSRSIVGASLYELVKARAFPDVITWERCTAAIEKVLATAIQRDSGTAAYVFAAYPRSLPIIAPTGRQVYQHEVAGRMVFIEMNTIHGVKSQTHAATLLLETSVQNSFDLKNLIPYLTGRKSLSKEVPKPGIAAAIRCGFVAISRPQSLLCLALKADHVTPMDRKRLEERGWNVVDVAGPRA